MEFPSRFRFDFVLTSIFNRKIFEESSQIQSKIDQKSLSWASWALLEASWGRLGRVLARLGVSRRFTTTIISRLTTTSTKTTTTTATTTFNSKHA